MSLSYGQIYVHDGAAAQAVTSTPAKMTGFATVGPSSNLREGGADVVPDLSNDQIAVKAGGVYEIIVNASIQISAASIVQLHARFGTTEIASLGAQHEVITAGADKAVNLAFSGVYVPATDGNISVYIESSNNANITPVHASLSIKRIG